MTRNRNNQPETPPWERDQTTVEDIKFLAPQSANNATITRGELLRRRLDRETKKLDYILKNINAIKNEMAGLD